MAFHNLQFLLFFLAVMLLAWSSVRWPRLRRFFLLGASYAFYISGGEWMVVLLAVSTGIDFVCSNSIARTESPKSRKRWLIVSLVGNLALLGVFKYAGFFIESIQTGLTLLGLHAPSWHVDIVLPIGISFYTFQSMSYTLDIYWRKLQPEKSFVNFALYVAFFPQLIAGPIVRAGSFLHQLHQMPRRLEAENVHSGLALIIRGLIKKVVLADYLAVHADLAFNYPGGVGTAAAWLGVYAFAFQIYFDFSGYTDLARGTGRLLGFELPENFLAPYGAQNLADFWRRWHVSLSTWLRDYLYIPLGGNRGTPFFTRRNLFITMTLGGLWHGAAWTFVLWGLIHGLLLGFSKGNSKAAVPPPSVWRVLLSRLATFHIVCALWVIFRAADLASAGRLVGALFEYDPRPYTFGMLLAALIVALGLIVQWLPTRLPYLQWAERVPVVVRGGLYAAAALVIAVFSAGVAKPFLYFQF